MNKAILCDVDGTIALMKGKRGPFEYIAAMQDEPNLPVIKAVTDLVKANNYKIIYLSARENVTFPATRCQYNNAYDLTYAWISRNVYDRLNTQDTFKLVLRKKGDYRTDWVVKYELYRDIIQYNYDVQLVFDDRDQVVKMWRDNGLPCFQVAFGNF